MLSSIAASVVPASPMQQQGGTSAEKGRGRIRPQKDIVGMYCTKMGLPTVVVSLLWYKGGMVVDLGLTDIYRSPTRESRWKSFIHHLVCGFVAQCMTCIL